MRECRGLHFYLEIWGKVTMNEEVTRRIWVFSLNSSSKRDCKPFNIHVLKKKKGQRTLAGRRRKRPRKKKEMKTNKGFEETVSIQSLALDLATGEFSLEGINFVSQSY